MYSDVVPHRENASVKGWRTSDKESELQLYESENPWGPWRILYNEKPWGGKEHSFYLPQIPNKWRSKGGLSEIIMFAGDYVGHNYEYYGFMTQSFVLKLKD